MRMCFSSRGTARARPAAAPLLHRFLLYLVSYPFVSDVCVHAAHTLPTQTGPNGSTSSAFEASTSDEASPVSSSSSVVNNHRSNLVKPVTPDAWQGIWTSREAAQVQIHWDSDTEEAEYGRYLRYRDHWKEYMSDPAFEESLKSIDPVERANLVSLLHEPPARFLEPSSAAPAKASAERDATNTSSRPKVAATQSSSISNDLPDNIKQLIHDEVDAKVEENNKAWQKKFEQIQQGTSSTSLQASDCGFGEFNYTSWIQSGAVDTMRKERKKWQETGAKKTFYNYLFRNYVPGLAKSQTYCNGRGHCSLVNCGLIDRSLDPTFKRHIYFILETYAHYSRITLEEAHALDAVLGQISTETINLVHDFTPMMQHEEVRQAKEAEDAKKAARIGMMQMIIGSLIPIFCLCVPGGKVIEGYVDKIVDTAFAAAEMAGKAGGSDDKKATRKDKVKTSLNKRLGAVVGNGIGSAVAFLAGGLALGLAHKDAMSAGKSAITEVIGTMDNYQRQMRKQIEEVRNTVNMHSECILNGTGLGEHDIVTETEDGLFLLPDLEDRAYLDTFTLGIETRVVSGMINYAWRSNFVYIVMADVHGGCTNDMRSDEKMRVCLPEVPDKVFYFQRMDDAWNHRGKDVVTSPNGWSKLEERLNITLPNIARASYAWYKAFKYDDYDKIKSEQMQSLSKTGGPLYGVFKLPIAYSPGGDIISEIGDPVLMATKHENEEYRPPCIVGRNWRTSHWGRDEETYAFIKASGLYTHPSYHLRCQKGRAHCKVDQHTGTPFDNRANMRFQLPWGDCAGGQEMKGNKHHYCYGNSNGTVQMRMFTHCEPVFESRPLKQGEVPP